MIEMVKNIKYFLRLFAVLLALICHSCKKNHENTDIPLITIYKPIINASFSYNDSVQILVNVTSKNPLKTIAYVFTEEKTGREYFKTFYQCNSSSFVIDTSILWGISNTDTYFFSVNAYNGIQSTSKTLGIKSDNILNNAKFYVVTKQDNATINIYTINNSGVIDNKIPIHFNAHKYLIVPEGIILMNQYDQGIVGINPDNGVEFMKLPSVYPMNFKYFTDVYYNEDLLYTGSYDGLVNAYNMKGFKMLTFKVQHEAIPCKINVLGGFGYIQACKIGQNSSLHSYYLPSGSIYNIYNLNDSVVNLFRLDNFKNILFSNKNEELDIYELENSTTLINRILSFPIKPNIVKAINSEKYLIASNNNEIYLYNHLINQISEVQLNREFSNIEYLRANNVLYLCNDNILYFYDFTNLQCFDSLSFDSKIVEILCLN